MGGKRTSGVRAGRAGRAGRSAPAGKK